MKDFSKLTFDAMISALMNVDDQFQQFDDISINVRQAGVQLRMKKNWKGVSMSLKNENRLRENEERMYE
tara:strand:+ start:3720 stop:3926 length:207 start_codon:yes stop_codon:yes gene_type:complete